MIPYKHWNIWQDNAVCQRSRTSIRTVVVGSLHPEVNLGSILRPLDIFSLPDLLIDVGTNFFDFKLTIGEIFLKLI